MTATDPKSAGEQETGEKVGYGSPPKASRFRPGRSGNPRGRPRKVKYRPLALEKSTAAILNALYSPVVIRKGEKTKVVPLLDAALQAAMPKIVDDPFLLLKVIQAVQKLESGHRKEQIQEVMRAFRYKEEANREIERCKAEGKPEPQFRPHPNDVHIDLDNCIVTSTGPVTYEQEQIFKKLRERKEYWAREIKELEAIVKDMPDNAAVREDLAKARQIYKSLDQLGI